MKYLLVSLLLLVTACAPLTAEPKTPHVTVKTDEFSKEIELDGWGIYQDLHFDAFRTWRLKTYINKSSFTVRHQLYIIVYEGLGRKNFPYASDETSQKLNIYSIHHENGKCEGFKCRVIEVIGVDLDEADLRSHTETGYRIKIKDTGWNELILNITPQMIKMQLAELAKYRK